MSPPAAELFSLTVSEAQVDRGCDNVTFDLCACSIFRLSIVVIYIPAYACPKRTRTRKLVRIVGGVRVAGTIVDFTVIGFKTNGPRSSDVVRHTVADAFFVTDVTSNVLIILGVTDAECKAANADRA